MNEILTEINDDAVALFSAKKAFEFNILPLRIENEYLHIALTDKNDIKLINDISFFTGLKINAVELPSDVILAKLKEIYPDSEFKNENEVPQSTVMVSEYSTVEFVNQIISSAIKSGASDIHFEVYDTYFRVRYRIDGHLKETLNLPVNRSLAISSRLKIMSNLDISEKRRPQDGKIRFNYNNVEIDIRLSTLPTSFGEKIVLRILDKSQLRLDLKKLGLDSKQHGILTKNINCPYGMILVTGPTGSGKTTTLYAVLQTIHSVEKNIMTVEDPVEYNLSGINQTNVKPDIGFDFANALRAFLRQDPDVIMVGEIRDRETAEIAIRASLTGHLVFSTLHTNDSISAITRLTDMGIEPFLVASSLKLVIAQRLVRTLCSCKIKRENGHADNSLEAQTGYDKGGCEQCGYTGYKGRSAVYELLDINNDISELISKNSNIKDIKNAALRNGFKSLRDSGIQKISLGITTYEEVLRETML
jgi:type IV pilus assembly protein PilB